MSKRRQPSDEMKLLYAATMALVEAYKDRLSNEELAEALLRTLSLTNRSPAVALIDTSTAFEAAVERKKTAGSALIS